MRLWGRMGDGRGNLRVAKTPPLQEALRGIATDQHTPHGHQKETAWRKITARRVATSFEKRENRL